MPHFALDHCGTAAYIAFVRTVVETRSCIADAKHAGLSQAERDEIVKRLAANPGTGELIVGSGGARKVRVAGRGKGKSGGYRAITYFGGDDIPVFLIALFSKGERANLSKAEINEPRETLSEAAKTYRKDQRTRKRRGLPR